MKIKRRLIDYDTLEDHVIFWAYTKLKHIRDFENVTLGTRWLKPTELASDAQLVYSLLMLLQPLECRDTALIAWARGFISTHDFLIAKKNSNQQLNVDIHT